MRSRKVQKIYVNTVSGEIAKLDSWANWKFQIGVYKLSSKKFIRLNHSEMRLATPEEETIYNRASKEKVECMVPIKQTALSANYFVRKS